MSKEVSEYQLQSGINTRARAKKVNQTVNTIEESVATPNLQNHRKRKKAWTMTHDELSTIENVPSKLMPLTKVVKLSKTVSDDDKSTVKKEPDKVSLSSLAESNITKTPKKISIKKLKSPKSATSRVVNSKSRRSTKTPKKSPKSLSSPKTGSSEPLKLLKVPRKLMLTPESPRVSKEYTPDETNAQLELIETNINGHVNLNPTNSDSRKERIISTKNGVKRFSKSPKIILHSPKIKVKPGPKSSKSKVELKMQTKLVSSQNTWKPDSNRTRKTVSLSPSTAVHEQESSITKTSRNQSPVLKELVVLLDRLPSDTEKSVKRNSVSIIVAPNSTSTVADPSVLYLGTNGVIPTKSLEYEETSQVETVRKPLSRAMVASTPRDKREIGSDHNNQYPLRNLNLSIENESAPSLFVADCTKERQSLKVSEASTDAIFAVESEQDVETKNGTYELLEPKTPDLRERLRGKDPGPKTMQEVQILEKPKKSYKVRFASSTPKLALNQDTVLSTPLSTVKPIVARPEKLNLSKSILKSTPGSIRKRSNSVDSSSVSRIHRGSNSLIEAKRSKKIPDFSSIHKKLFAKSESLVDGKKRLQERHKALTKIKMDLSKTRTPTKEKIRLATEPTNGPYNRFGFKIRKNQATESMVKKTNTVSRDTKQVKNRIILKGVRMNRRFELQMKLRNINS